MTTRRIAVVLAATLTLSGCVRHERYRFVQPQNECFSPKDPFPDGTARPFPSLDCRDAGYMVGFVEFDQQGQLIEPLQQDKALALITEAKKRLASKKVITLVYVHGWKNNANQARPGAKAQDVERFRGALRALSVQAEVASPGEAVPIVGLYVAWKGKSLMGPGWLTWLSYWDRRNTANRVGSEPLTALLNKAIETTVPDKESDPSRVLLIGHSFGARVLEHAIEKGVTLYDDEKTRKDAKPVRPRVDLVLYVNAATDARLSLNRVQALKKDPITVRHPNYKPAECTKEKSQEPTCRSYPLLVAISSRGDAATKFVQPIANTINMDDGTAITLPTGTFADKVPSVRGIKRGAPGHMRFMQSHAITEIACPISPGAAPKCTADDPACAFAFRTAGQCDACFKASLRGPQPVPTAKTSADPVPEVFNDTAFWIMDVDDRVIKDHGDIWNRSTLNMLGQLMAPRGFFHPTMAPLVISASN